MVEFALVLPVLLLILLAVLDFGKVFNYWMNTTHITAEGARYAAVNRKPEPGNTASLQQQLLTEGDTEELRSGGTASLPTPAQVCVSFPNGTSNPGDPVRVTMTFDYHWIGFLSGMVDALGPSKSVSASSTMRLEAVPTAYTEGCT
jgi:Flp pilus assembly protein TadG